MVPVAAVDAERARLGLGYLPQEPSVFRQLTVRQNLEIALDQTDLNPQQRRDRRDQLIEDFHLVAFVDRCGYQLSGGERRRCEVARALAVGAEGPRYLLLDEPFAGVDPLAVADLQELIQALRSRGMGILVTDHNVRETLAITDRAYILNDGSILASGQSRTVADDPGAPLLPRGGLPVVIAALNRWCRRVPLLDRWLIGEILALPLFAVAFTVVGLSIGVMFELARRLWRTAFRRGLPCR